MKWKIVIIMLFVGIVFSFIYLSSDYTRADVYVDGDNCYAIVMHGTCLDSSIELWTLVGNRWLTYYLDHEVLALGSPKMIKRDNFLVFTFRRKELGVYNPLVHELKYPEEPNNPAHPNQFIWGNADGSVECATVIQIQGNKEAARQILSEGHIGAKCFRAIEKKMRSVIHMDPRVTDCQEWVDGVSSSCAK